MSHSCHLISSHKHQLCFRQRQKRSLETTPEASLGNTFTPMFLSPPCYLLILTQKDLHGYLVTVWSHLSTIHSPQDFPRLIILVLGHHLVPSPHTTFASCSLFSTSRPMSCFFHWHYGFLLANMNSMNSICTQGSHGRRGRQIKRNTLQQNAV